MPRLPQISGKRLAKIFKRDGWYEVGTEGSHLKMRKNLHPMGQRTVIIPQHRVLKKGTLSGILKDSGISIEKLRKLL